MSELEKIICCVGLWSALFATAWMTGQITSHLSKHGGHTIRCYEERIIDLAVEQSISRSKQFDPSDLNG